MQIEKEREMNVTGWQFSILKRFREKSQLAEWRGLENANYDLGNKHSVYSS